MGSEGEVPPLGCVPTIDGGRLANQLRPLPVPHIRGEGGRTQLALGWCKLIHQLIKWYALKVWPWTGGCGGPVPRLPGVPGHDGRGDFIYCPKGLTFAIIVICNL